MNRVIFICFLLSGFTSIIFSQNDSMLLSERSTSSISLRLGFNDFHIKDKYISPYIFNGITYTSEIAYQFKNESNRHNIQLLFSTGKINSDIQTRNATSYIGYIAYTFTHKIKSWNIAGNRFNFHIGTGLSTYFEYLTLNSEDIATNSNSYDDSWYVSHSINLNLYGEYELGERNILSILITSPVIRLVTRPANGHYFNLDNTEVIENNKLKVLTGGKLEFVWNNLEFITLIEYQAPLSERFNFHTAYMFGYAASDKPADLLSANMYMNNFLVGVDWLL